MPGFVGITTAPGELFVQDMRMPRIENLRVELAGSHSRTKEQRLRGRYSEHRH